MAPLPTSGSTDILLKYYLLLYPVSSQVKSLLLLLFLPVPLHLPQVTRENLEFPLFFLPSFFHSSQPSTIGTSCAKAAPLHSPRTGFLLLSPDFFPVLCTPPGCQVTRSVTWSCLWANTGAERQKKIPFIPCEHMFAVPLSQKLCCPA